MRVKEPQIFSTMARSRSNSPTTTVMKRCSARSQTSREFCGRRKLEPSVSPLSTRDPSPATEFESHDSRPHPRLAQVPAIAGSDASSDLHLPCIDRQVGAKVRHAGKPDPAGGAGILYAVKVALERRARERGSAISDRAASEKFRTTCSLGAAECAKRDGSRIRRPFRGPACSSSNTIRETVRQ